MAKKKTVYVCQKCGVRFPKWQGRCDQCGAWNSLVETTVSKKSKIKSQKSKISAQPQPISEISTKEFKRLKTGIGEFDRVLGGGIVPGSSLLLAGEPGIGKSTLLLQVAGSLASRATQASPASQAILYVCGEESPEQIKSRAQRLGVAGGNLLLLPETDVDAIASILSAKEHSLVVVDSIQSLSTEELSGGAGSIGQVRECAYRLHQVSKKRKVPIIFVGHITKSGTIAGPKVLEHLVDGVFTLEGERRGEARVLRSEKNRFGPTEEVGVFRMTERGMEEVKNPSKLFLSQRKKDTPGTAVTATMEGTRPILLELQALVHPSSFKYPRRTSLGFSHKRLEILLAVLARHAGISFQTKDVYVSVTGGISVREPGADLALTLALASSTKDKPLPSKICAFGEVGLTGEVRPVPRMEQRAKEAKRLGFEKIISPPKIKSISQALKESLSPKL